MAKQGLIWNPEIDSDVALYLARSGLTYSEIVSAHYSDQMIKVTGRKVRNAKPKLPRDKWDRQAFLRQQARDIRDNRLRNEVLAPEALVARLGEMYAVENLGGCWPEDCLDGMYECVEYNYPDDPEERYERNERNKGIDEERREWLRYARRMVNAMLSLDLPLTVEASEMVFDRRLGLSKKFYNDNLPMGC